MPKILITGASGFVGSFLVNESLQRELQVYAGVRKTSNRIYLEDPAIRFFEIDFGNPASYIDELQKENFDYVIHNAGLTRAKDPSDLFKVNAEFSESFATSCLSRLPNLKKFVFISSLAAYGPADQHDFQEVHSKLDPKPITAYGRSKLQAEKLLKNLKELPLGIIRPTAVFGPREKDLYALFKTVKNGIAPKIGFSEQGLTFIYVKDLARLTLDATLSDIENFEFFASDTHLYSSKTLNKYIAEALNRKPIHLTIPVSLLKLMALFNEIYGKLSGSYPAFNFEKVNELASQSWACDSTTIQKDFNFAPAYSLADAIAETVDWYKSENWL